MIFLEEFAENGLPIPSEFEVLSQFEDWLDDKIKGENKEKPNALFLAKITWNETCEMIWRVFDPEITHLLLNDLIENKDYLRAFDYRIDYDENWKLATWHLKNC